MTTTTESTLAAELAVIRADLAELRRYVRTKPAHVRDGVSAAVWELSGALPKANCERDRATLGRLMANLQTGLVWMDACPGALDGYLAGADWELAVLIGRLEGGMSEC